MSYLDRIEECNRHDLTRFFPLWIRGVRVGHVRRDRVEFLESLSGFVVEGSAIKTELDPHAATSRLDDLAEALVAGGRLSGLHGERFPVAARFAAEPLAVVDRAMISWLGVTAFGVHLNGFVREADGLRMWVAVRAGGKLTFPGMLDNMVAGGLPIGISPDENVRKECHEEAGIPQAIAARAVSVGAVSYCVEHDRGLKPDTMFCYDLELPREFEPRPVDGEVERFESWPIERVAERVRDSSDFKFNCNLVIIDFLVRHGVITTAEPDYTEIVHGLHRPLRAEAGS